jgi:undecaprenyl-diphosphatase
VLHAGSLLAIVLFYRKTLWQFLNPKMWRLAWMLIIATIPAGVAGVALEASGFAKELFGNLFMIGFTFLITGTLLRLSEKPKLVVNLGDKRDAQSTPLEKITCKQAIAVGIGQMFAILPGLSRSGTTITVGILCGINRNASGMFSFLMAIPVIAGATVIHLYKIIKNPPQSDDVGFLPLGVGLLISALISFGALSFLTKLIQRGKLSYFTWYLYILGFAVIFWQIAMTIKKVN